VSGQQFPLFPQLNAGGSQPPSALHGQLGAGAQPPAGGYDNRAAMPTGNVVQGAMPVSLPPVEIAETRPPQGGLASEQQPGPNYRIPSLQDRGVYHAADAMRDLVDMGDAPSCHVCGAIMTRNGSCYRCMSCGSTSGCS
jgi:ribonucleoside-diphosphate reductase alpha chain